MASSMFYPMTVHIPGGNALTQVTTTFTLPEQGQLGDVLILVGDTNPGIQIWSGSAWTLGLGQQLTSEAAVFGYTMDVYVNPTVSPTLVAGAVVYLNGVLQGTPVVTPGTGVWVVTNKNRSQIYGITGGTASSLSIRFQGYENTGIYVMGTNMVFVVNGTEVMRMAGVNMVVSGNMRVTNNVNVVFSAAIPF